MRTLFLCALIIICGLTIKYKFYKHKIDVVEEHINLKNYNEAEILINQMILKSPTDTKLYILRSKIYELTQNKSKMINDFEKIKNLINDLSVQDKIDFYEHYLKIMKDEKKDLEEEQKKLKYLKDNFKKLKDEEDQKIKDMGDNIMKYVKIVGVILILLILPYFIMRSKS